MSVKNLLVELFVEELPPKALKKLGEAFADNLSDSLKAQGLTAVDSKVTAFASPRRLAANISAVAEKAADKMVSLKLMPVNVGLDADGNATPALLKRLGALGADASVVANLKRAMDGKAEVLFFDQQVTGVHLADGLQTALNEALGKLPIPKVMTYQLTDGWSSVNFVRPAHGLVALHGADVVPVTALGLTAGNKTRGHRFEAAVSPVTIRDADSYEQQMQAEGAVIASFAARRDEIKRQLAAAAARQNLKPIEDEALLDEVTALVERPNVLLGQFETEFLEVPQECLILTMKANQKYFPLLDASGKLTNKFLIVSNISPADPSAVIGGNERVVRPRLADAKFFFDQDRKKTLESRVPGLAKVVYHNKLGSQAERTERVVKISQAIALKLGEEKLAKNAGHAAVIAKTDLLTEMVGEFPELQGTMGRYYALNDGLSIDIADAIEDHYKPRFAGDELPRNLTGICVALADKLETLVGMFGIGQIPTGDKDPFALRRHALGIIRMLVEKDLPLDFRYLIDCSINAFNGRLPDISVFHQRGLLDSNSHGIFGNFIYERFSGLLREQGIAPEFIEAVLTLGPERFGQVSKRLMAVRDFSSLPEAPALASANKRVGNILKKAEGVFEPKVDYSLLKEPAEIALAKTLAIVKLEADKTFELGDYTASLQFLAALKAPVDDFFDNVMVNADDPSLKANRLALLAALHSTMNRVADLSKLAA